MCNKGLNDLILVKKSNCFHQSKNQKLNKNSEPKEICHDGVGSPMEGAATQRDRQTEPSDFVNSERSFLKLLPEEGRKECGPVYCLSTTISQLFPFQRRKGTVGLSSYECHLFFNFRIMFFGWELGNSASAGPSLKAITSPTSTGRRWRLGHSGGFSASRGPAARASCSVRGSLLLSLEGGCFLGPGAGSVPTF